VSDENEPWAWLRSTVQLQEETYGYPIVNWVERLDRGGEIPHGLPPYLLWNVFAVYNELAELAYEFSWKPWATDEPFVNRRRLLDEGVDILHFIGNILVAIGVTDEEFWDAYKSKQLTNRLRAASGSYSAKKGGVAEGSDDGASQDLGSTASE